MKKWAKITEMPLLPLWGWPPRAPHFQTLKVVKPNTLQLHVASHSTNEAKSGPCGVFLHPLGPNTPLIVPDARTWLAATRAAAGGGPMPNVKMAELNSATPPGG